MVIKDIEHFAQVRPKARAYFCYLFSRNLPNRLPSVSVEAIVPFMQKIMGDVSECEGVYLLDDRGVQISPTFTQNKQFDDDIGVIRSNRAYYYRAVRERRCTITDPYPSLITKELSVTVSQPIFDENDKLKYIACLDIPLDTVLRIAHPMAVSSIFGRFFTFSYTMFTIALTMVALLLFVNGIEKFIDYGIIGSSVEINNIFEATILLTLSLAIFDLVKTLFEEEVLGNNSDSVSHFNIHKTMVRFLGSIIIALSIEALMLVFKFAMTGPEKLINAIYILGGVSALLIGLAIYMKFVGSSSRE